MIIEFDISKKVRDKFRASCEVVLRNVGDGTVAAAYEAGSEIFEESINQVPCRTTTLLSSAYFGIGHAYTLSDPKTSLGPAVAIPSEYFAILGYGAYHESANFSMSSESGATEVDKWIREPSNPINPDTSLSADDYAVKVHEDLKMKHKSPTKAKFLEDPVREYGISTFGHVVAHHWRDAVKWETVADTIAFKNFEEMFNELSEWAGDDHNLDKVHWSREGYAKDKSTLRNKHVVYDNKTGMLTFTLPHSGRHPFPETYSIQLNDITKFNEFKKWATKAPIYSELYTFRGTEGHRVHMSRQVTTPLHKGFYKHVDGHGLMYINHKNLGGTAYFNNVTGKVEHRPKTNYVVYYRGKQWKPKVVKTVEYFGKKKG